MNKMKLCFLFIVCFWGQYVCPQTINLDLVYEVIHKAEKNKQLLSSEISLLMESYEDNSLKNNAELSECRSGAIIFIMYNTYNLKKLLCTIKSNRMHQDIVVDELGSPIYELDKNKIKNNLKEIKGYRKIKNKIKEVLK